MISQSIYGQCNLSAVNAGNDIAICIGATTQLKAVQTGGVEANVTYVWTPATGLDNANISNPVASPHSTTTYIVTATEGTCIKTDDLVVKVNPLPVVDFSFNNDNACSGNAVQFTSSVTGTGPFSYTWNFGDGITSTEQNPSHEFTSLGCGTEPFVVTFTVTDAAGCSESITHNVFVQQKPDIGFQDVNNQFDPFSNCSNASASNPVYQITVGNISNSNCISSYSINWGDGTSATNISFPISHTYSRLGAYNMVVTALGTNGCSNSKAYIIKNVSNPSGGIISPGSTTNLCAPTSDLQFEISKWGTNSPGTTYEISYGDNSPILTLTQEQLVSSTYFNSSDPSISANYPVPHSYTKTSCPEAQFTVTLTVTNACGSTPFTAGNISVLNKSEANFIIPISACVNKSVLFTNNSIPGYSQNCSRNSIDKWDFGDGTPVTTTQPSLPHSTNHTYSNPGNYAVILTEQNFCGITTKTQQICVEPPLIPLFTLSSPNPGCAPFAVTATNATIVSNACNLPSYLWIVTYTSGNCGTSSSYSFTGETNSSSKDPSFLFTNPGTYTIKLSVTNSCGTVVSNAQKVTVIKPPTVSINVIPSICQTLPTTAINPIVSVADCGSLPLSYEWSFPGGSPATSASVNPGPISYTTPGTYTVSLQVTNECGTTFATGNSFTIKSTPDVNDITSQINCKGHQSDAIIFSGTVAGSTYSWVNSHPGIGLASSGTGDINSFTLTNAGTSVLMSTITVIPSFNGCPGPSKSFTIAVNPTAQVNKPADQVICNSGSTSPILFTTKNTGGITTYSWTNDSPGIGLAVNGTGDIGSFAAENSTNSPITATISVTPTFSNGGISCYGTPQAFTITVNPASQVNTPADQVICNGQPALVNFSTMNTGGVTSYSWTNNATGIGLAATGTGDIRAFKTMNTTDSPVTASITVTPTFINGGAGCPGATETFTITVNPSPGVMFSPGNQTVCSGENTSLVTLSSITTGVTYEWSAIVPVGITGAEITGTGTIPVQTLENTTNIPLVVIYKATASLAAGATCAGAESVYTITVNPKPSVSEKLAAEVCSGSNFAISPANGIGNIVPSGTTYTWSTPTISPAGALTGATAQGLPQATISQQLTNITHEFATATYKVTPLSGTCIGKPFEVIVTVKPTPLVDLTGNISLCNGEQNPGINFTGAEAGTVFNWTNNVAGIGLGASGSGPIPAFTAVNMGTTPKIATITVTSTANGCVFVADPFYITINPLLPVSVSIAANANDICPGTVVNYTATPTNGGLQPTYQWKVNGIVVGTNGASYSYSPEDGDKIETQLTSNALCPSGSPAQSNVIPMVVFSGLPASISIEENVNNICPGESSTFTATAFNGGSNPLFQWFVNGAKVGTNQAVYSYDPVDGDIVSCQLLSSNTCSSNGAAVSDPIRMFVSPPALQPSFEIEQLNDCAPIKVLLKNNSLPGGLAYIWDFGDGIADTTATPTDVSHTFENFTAVPVEFSVSLKIVTRFTHCFNILTKKIIVRPELFAGSPVNYMGCSPFVQRFENAYAGAKTYRWIDSRKKLLSDQFQPTLTFTTSKGVDSTHIVYLIAESFFGCSDTIVNRIKVSPALAMPSFTYSGKADCGSVTYVFKNTSPEGAHVFIWDFADGTINETFHANEVVTHTFSNGLDVAVPFNVTLTSSSGNSCRLSVSQKIVVDPEYIAGFPVTFQGCSPVTRKFMNAYDGSKSYQWKSSDWKLLSNEISPTFTFSALPGRDSTHLVYLITESLNGCIDTVINKVIVRAADKAAFSALPTEGCAPLFVQFTNASSAKTNGYQWYFNDGSDYSIIENPSHIFIDSNGSDSKYKVTLVAFNQYGCADTAFQEIHLLPTPQVDFLAQPIMQTYPDRTVKLTNLTPAGNWTYSWNLGDQKPSITGPLPDYTFDLPGEYVISLTAKGNQCENTKRVKVTINPGTPVAAFEPDTLGCAPLRVNFRNNSQNGSRYQWDFGNGSQSVDFSPSITYFDEGTFTVKLKVFNQFGVMSETERRIVVHPVPKALFKPLPYRVRIPAQSATFFNSSENAGNFLWDFGDGSSSFDIQPIHQYTQTGLFNVTLTITSAEGCKDTFLLPEAVEAFSDELEVPNAFMPDKEGPNGGIYEPGDPRNHIFYPSVAVGDLTEYELMIYNRWGNLLFDTKEAQRGWDGYYNGILSPQDVYIWKIRCKFKSGSIVTKTGDVTLIR